jgi:phytoene/squalene synthetase
MSAFKDIIIDIEDEIRAGDLSYAEIAVRYDVPLETVEEILQAMIDDEDEYDGQPDELTEWMDFDVDC